MDSSVFAFLASTLTYLAQGLVMTMQLAIASFAMGFCIAALLTPPNIFSSSLRLLSRSYIELFRGTPLLVQIFIIYFGLPALGLKFDAVTAGILALGLNSGAYQAEILRAAVKSIPESQFLSAESLGMSTMQIYRYVVLPQAVRVAIPALVNEVVTLIKESSLVSVIGVVELTRRGEYLVAFTFRPFEVYLAVAFLYFIVCMATSYSARIIEKKFKIPGYERWSR